MCWLSAAALQAPQWRRCWRSKAGRSFYLKKRTTRAFTLANRCCREMWNCSRSSACAIRSPGSACPSSASSSCRPTWTTAVTSISPKAGTRRRTRLGRCVVPTWTKYCFATLPPRVRRPSKAPGSTRSISTMQASPCVLCSTMAPRAPGGRASWSMRAGATPSWRTSSKASRRTRSTTARRCSVTSATRGDSKASAKAISASAGSRTAGSGSFRSPTAPRVWAPCAGPIT